ncbi:MAG: hypothetical protein AB7P34_15870 [Vicinamibacterales bacterium]
MATIVDERDTALLNAATERFELRLAEECGRVRTDFRAEMRGLRSELRADMRDLRTELHADFKVEVANTRADLLKWSFLFWIGQVAAISGLVTLLR